MYIYIYIYMYICVDIHIYVYIDLASQVGNAVHLLRQEEWASRTGVPRSKENTRSLEPPEGPRHRPTVGS